MRKTPSEHYGGPRVPLITRAALLALLAGGVMSAPRSARADACDDMRSLFAQGMATQTEVDSQCGGKRSTPSAEGGGKSGGGKTSGGKASSDKPSSKLTEEQERFLKVLEALKERPDAVEALMKLVEKKQTDEHMKTIAELIRIWGVPAVLAAALFLAERRSRRRRDSAITEEVAEELRKLEEKSRSGSKDAE